MEINGIEIDFSKQRGYFFHMDCMDALKQMPDKSVSLAIVDPPYGAGFTEGGGCQGWFSKYHQSEEKSSQFCKVERERERERKQGELEQVRRQVRQVQTHFTFGMRKRDRNYQQKLQEAREQRKKIISWDTAPGKEYFQELFRVSRNQIIWGGNYFELPPTRCFVVWRKLTISDSFSMAMAEYAWTSFNDNAKVFECAPQGKASDPRFHPTSKPIALYKWLLEHYAKKGDIILDSHVGSASSLIACEQMGFNYIGFEIDDVYYKKAKERLERETAQMTIFDLMGG